MKRKFINLLLAVVFLLGSAQVLTSCKDNMEDLYAQLKDDNLTLENALKAEIEVLKGQITALQGVTNDLQGQINGLQNQINGLDDIYVSHAELNGLIDKYIASVSRYNTLKEALDALQKVYDEVEDAHGPYNTIGERFAAIEAALQAHDARLTALEELTSTIPALNEFMNEWKPLLGDMKNDIATALETANQALALADANKARLDALEEAVAAIKSCNCPDAQALIDAKYTQIMNEVNQLLENYVTNDALATALADYATKQELADAVDALETAIDDLRTEAQQMVNTLRDELQIQINQILGRLDDLETTVGDLKDAFETYKTETDQKISDLQDAVDDLEEAVEAINQVLSSVVDRVENLENRISSIVLQGSENDVIGYISTPFGINMNMLLGYYGQNTNAVTISFPNTRGSIEFDNQDGKITEKDMQILQQCGLSTESFASGEIFIDENEGNLGKVYLTLNPANIDLEGKTFTIVNSQDKDTKIQLKNLRPSDKELTFGWTRTETSPNGFYEADATIAADDADGIRIKIDANNAIKQQAQKVLQDKTLRSLLGLGNVVYNEFTGILPALGVKAAWDENVYDAEGNVTGTKAQAVYSQYGLGAATYQPLSYRFIYGQSFKQIALPDLRNETFTFVNGTTKVDLSSVMINVGAASIPLDLQVVIPSTDVVSFTLIGLPKSATVSPTGEITYSDFTGTLDVQADLSDLKAQITAYVNATFTMVSAQAQAQIEAGFNASLASLESQINAAFASLEVQINQTIDELIASLNVQANDKYQKFVSKFYDSAMVTYLDRFIERLNGVLADPNHYLQTTLLYHDGTTYSKMSNVKAMPTVFKGSGNAIILAPTTFTGEVITPAYKKIVAVTNVYKNDDKSISAKGGDAQCMQILKKLNAQSNICEVIPGTHRTIPFSFEGAKGYTVEIVYQGLDYQGVTSTDKYYMSVK